MSLENTYSAFHFNGSIIVLHKRGHEEPQALTIFREPLRMGIHERKMIGFYLYSHEAVTLLDDPQHNAVEVLNAISLMIEKRGKAKIYRRLKSLACVLIGALMVSSAWYMNSGDEHAFAVNAAVSSASAPSQTHSPTVVDKLISPVSAGAAQPQPSAGTTLSEVAASESQNMQAIMHDSRRALPSSPDETLQPAAPVAVPPVSRIAQNPSAPLATQQAPSDISSRLQMAETLKRNADKGMFTITLSAGHERTLYAFLDPTCSVCRTMEPAIEQLAREFNVVVFPVSVVNDGGNAVEKIVPLLCEKDPAKRAAGWQALFRADAGMTVPGLEASAPVDAECARAAAAVVAVNDMGFRTFGFQGTPWVLTDTGFRLSTGLLAEPAKVDLFLKTTDPLEPQQAAALRSALNIQE